jgi:hypothetical protein
LTFPVVSDKLIVACRCLRNDRERKAGIMNKTGRMLLFLAVLMVPCPTIPAATLDCSGGIISEGDSRTDLLIKCGEPDAKESHQEELTERLDGTKHKSYITVEEWTYNFGPTRLMRIVTMKNGKVAFIRAGNYGYTKGAEPGQRECSEQVLSVGDTKSDVLSRCGEPTWKDTRQEEVKQRLDSGVERKVFVTIDEWTYNLGPNRFLRILTFRNGKLAEIESGGYGYEMKQQDKQKSP